MPLKRLNRKILIASFLLALSGTVMFGIEWISSVLASRNAALKSGEVNATNVAHSISVQANLSFKAAASLLRELSSVRTENANHGDSFGVLMRAFTDGGPALFPEIDTVIVADAKGRAIYAWPSISGEKKTSEHLQMSSGIKIEMRPGLAIGAPQRSPISGQWIVPVTQALVLDGNLNGMAMVGLNLDYFLAKFKKLDVGRDGAIILGTLDGRILLRLPSSTDFIGKTVSDDPIFKDFSRRLGSSTLTASKTLDGVERIIYFERVEEFPLFVTAALGCKELLSDWYRSLTLQIGGTIFAALVIALMTIYLFHVAKLRCLAEKEIEKKSLSLMQLNERLEIQAMKDGLTGLANRRYLDEQLTRAIQDGSRGGTRLSLVMFDVDYFKKFNDLYGHIQGDYCLQAVAHEIQVAQRRGGDIAARYGGEEFVLLLPNTDLAGAHKIAEGVLSSIRALEYSHIGNTPGKVTVSAGVVSLIPNQQTKMEEIFSKADKALYDAKNAGRNRVCDWRPPPK